MVPSTPSFNPSKFQFNSTNSSSLNLTSNDGVFQVKDIEGATVFVEGVQIPYTNPAVQVNGFWLSHETNQNGQLILNSWANQEAVEKRNITAELNITKIEYSGVSYYPANKI